MISGTVLCVELVTGRVLTYLERNREYTVLPRSTFVALTTTVTPTQLLERQHIATPVANMLFPKPRLHQDSVASSLQRKICLYETDTKGF